MTENVLESDCSQLSGALWGRLLPCVTPAVSPSQRASRGVGASVDGGSAGLYGRGECGQPPWLSPDGSWPPCLSLIGLWEVIGRGRLPRTQSQIEESGEEDDRPTAT